MNITVTMMLFSDSGNVNISEICINRSTDRLNIICKTTNDALSLSDVAGTNFLYSELDVLFLVVRKSLLRVILAFFPW